VFSRTLDSVQGNARLAEASVAEEAAAALDATDKDVSIGGAGLAAVAIELGLVDELRMFRYPVVLGGGTPFLPPVTEDVPLDLVETRTFGSRVIYERYGRVRDESLTPPSESSAPRRTGYSPRSPAPTRLPCGYRRRDDRPVRALRCASGRSYRLVLAYAHASAAREVRGRLRRSRRHGRSPVDVRSRVDIRADDVPDGINAADHAAGLSSSLDNLAASVER
jgi:hypothetical protein